MLNLKKFAVTGGLSSGKSTVCQCFKQCGAYLVDADAILHRLYSSSSVCKQRVVDLLGQTVLTNNQLDRKKIAEHVFSDPKKLLSLEEIVHPMVFTEIEKELIEAATRANASFAVVEIPLLFETHSEGKYDATVCVLTDEALAKKRFVKAGFTEEEYEMRMSRQLPIQEKAKRADYVITNNGGKEEIMTQVKTMIRKTLGR